MYLKELTESTKVPVSSTREGDREGGSCVSRTPHELHPENKIIFSFAILMHLNAQRKQNHSTCMLKTFAEFPQFYFNT